MDASTIFHILLIEDVPPVFCTVAPQMSFVRPNVIGQNPHWLVQVIYIGCEIDFFQIIICFRNIETRIFASFCEFFINSQL